MQQKTHFQRILLKISGEAFARPRAYGLSSSGLLLLAETIQQVQQKGIEVGVVIGAGNLFRGVAGKELSLPRNSADQMGMLATLMNGIALTETLRSLGHQALHISSLPLPSIAEPFIFSTVEQALKEGAVTIFSGGTGQPYFTTDTAAALRACQIKADLLVKATQVDGVYSADPHKDPTAQKFTTLTFSEALEKNLRVMDSTAFAMCRDNKIKILVGHIFGDSSLINLLDQPHLATLISN